MSFTYVGGGEGTLTRGEILLHIVNHTTYHRGFVGEMIYGLKIRAPTSDLMVFPRDVPLALDRSALCLAFVPAVTDIRR